ncbi:SpaH/EbpB family LPXTG-anchored major pilin [Gordonibacter sp.]|uniref:SpaH/EbpB family LPXTG-anchored major pilin n=1 Tax=Gordonibacter sp. TaxID=1968902 RepID=UPI002FC61986
MEQGIMRLPSKLAAVLATAALAVSLAIGAAPAFALGTGGFADDGSASITLHKYKTPTDSSTPGTGAAGQQPPIGAQPLGGVQFALYKLDTAKVEGGIAGTPAVTKTPAASEVPAFLATYRDATFSPIEQSTGADGVAAWDSLKFGYYLLEEKSTGGANVQAAVPSIVTLPYAQQAAGGTTTFIKDVHVYPKNVSLDDVEKTVLDNPDLTAPYESLKYQISFRIPVAQKVYESDAACMQGTIVDTVPQSSTGKPMLGIRNDFTVVALSFDGTENALPAKDIGFSDTSATDGRVTWTITPLIAKAVEALNTTRADEPRKQISKLVIRATAQVTPHAFNASIDADGQTSIINSALVSITDSKGAVVVDRKQSTTPAIPTTGFQFTKVDGKGSPILSDTASFKLAASYSDAVAGKFIKSTTGSADLVASSNATNGKAVFSGLHSSDLTANGSAYTTVKQAVNAARANLGVPQNVDVWMVETKAPNGYRALQAPQKVTLQIVKATATSKVKTTVVSGPVCIVNTMNGQEGGGNFALPNTGGIGAIVFFVVGAGVVAFAVATFARSRKRDRDDRP